MSADARARHSSVSTTGYVDGLGRRSIGFDRESGRMLERLHLRPELGACEPLIRGAVERLATAGPRGVARPVGVERDLHRLVVLSELTPGHRLIDLVESGAADECAAPGLDAGLGLLVQALPAAAGLHAAGLVHGAIGLGRIILTPTGEIVLADAVFGSALQHLNLQRGTLWSSLSVLVPSGGRGADFDAGIDVSQIAFSVVQLALGRRITAADNPIVLAGALQELAEVAQIRGGEAFAADLRRLLQDCLAIDDLTRVPAAEAAAREARRLARAIGEEGGLRSLAELARAQTPCDEPAPSTLRPKWVATRVSDAPHPSPPRRQAGGTAPAEPGTLERTQRGDPMAAFVSAGPISSPPPPKPTPPSPLEPSRADRSAVAGTATGATAAPPEPKPERADEPLEASVPDQASRAAAAAARSETGATGEITVAPPPMEVLASPAIPAAVATPPVPPAPQADLAPPPAPQPDWTPSSSQPVFVTSSPPQVLAPPPSPPVFAPPPAPQMFAPPPPASLAPGAPLYLLPPQPPVFALPPPQFPAAERSVGVGGTGPASAPSSVPPVRIKTVAPPGYAPARRSLADDDDPQRVRALPYVNRGASEAPRSLPWKAIAAGLILFIGLLASRPYLIGRTDAPPHDEPPPTVVSEPVPPAKTGSLFIDSQPAGATVTIDGNEVGKTPLKLENVAAGRHLVTVATPTASVRRTVRVEAGKEVTVELPVYSGWVAVFSPIPLEVAEAGRSLGTTDATRILLSPGRHVLMFSNKEFGYSAREIVEITPGEQRVVNLQPRAIVNVNAVPWAEVWVDGTKAGETPLANLAVILGTREFVFRHPEHGERKLTVKVTMSTPPISVDFTATPKP